MSTDNPKPRKQNTPQLNRVVEAIKSGAYDDGLLEIQKALHVRRAVLEQDVLDLVQQVFGPEAEIVSKREQSAQHRPRPTPRASTGNSFVDKAQAAAIASLSKDKGNPDEPKDALSDLDATERQMQSETAIAGREGGGVIISGLSGSQIRD